MDAAEIRRASSADAVALADLVTQLGYTTSPAQMTERMERIAADLEYSTLVATQGGHVVGFVGLRLAVTYESDEPFGEIRAMAVAAGFRRKGIGRRLLQAAESALAERGARVIVLSSGNHRAGAHRFYEANGYAFTGRRYRKPL
jgi:ribosomal protein S18 acetylase RimI-like enzyme